MTLSSSWLKENSSPQHLPLYEASVCGCVDVSRVRCWVCQFQQEEVGEASLYDKVGSGGQGLQQIGVKNWLKGGNSVLKLEEIIWKSNYGQLSIKVNLLAPEFYKF
jgi:hypothetical protein